MSNNQMNLSGTFASETDLWPKSNGYSIVFIGAKKKGQSLEDTLGFDLDATKGRYLGDLAASLKMTLSSFADDEKSSAFRHANKSAVDQSIAECAEVDQFVGNLSRCDDVVCYSWSVDDADQLADIPVNGVRKPSDGFVKGAEFRDFNFEQSLRNVYSQLDVNFGETGVEMIAAIIPSREHFQNLVSNGVPVGIDFIPVGKACSVAHTETFVMMDIQRDIFGTVIESYQNKEADEAVVANDICEKAAGYNVGMVIPSVKI